MRVQFAKLYLENGFLILFFPHKCSEDETDQCFDFEPL